MDQPGKVANPARGQLNRENEYSRPRTSLRIWSRETGSAVPSRVSLLISILRLNMVLTHGIPPDFRGGVHLFPYLNRLLRHRVSPEFIGSHTIYCAPKPPTTPSGQSRVYRVTHNLLRTDGVRCRESAGTRPVVLKVVPVTGATILQVTTDQILCSSLFPHPLLV